MVNAGVSACLKVYLIVCLWYLWNLLSENENVFNTDEFEYLPDGNQFYLHIFVAILMGIASVCEILSIPYVGNEWLSLFFKCAQCITQMMLLRFCFYYISDEKP